MARIPTSQLLAMLRSPDPHARDELAYSELAQRIGAGEEDTNLERLGDSLESLFSDAEIQARSFAALALADVVERDRLAPALSPAAVRRWGQSFSAWYLGEDDLRGWDPKLGWLHAVAHGADALGAFGRSRHLGQSDLVALLALGGNRMLRPTDELFANQEEFRLAHGLALVLTRPEVDVVQSTGWLLEIGARLREGGPGPIPSWASNTLRTLSLIYVMADRGVRLPDGDPGPPVTVMTEGPAVKEAVADALSQAWPYLA